MPYTKTYVDEGKGLHKWAVGIVTCAEILADSLSDAEDEERCRTVRYKLIDYSATTGTKITPGEMCQMAQTNRKKIVALNTEVTIAVVAPAPTDYA